MFGDINWVPGKHSSLHIFTEQGILKLIFKILNVEFDPNIFQIHLLTLMFLLVKKQYIQNISNIYLNYFNIYIGLYTCIWNAGIFCIREMLLLTQTLFSHATFFLPQSHLLKELSSTSPCFEIHLCTTFLVIYRLAVHWLNVLLFYPKLYKKSCSQVQGVMNNSSISVSM